MAVIQGNQVQSIVYDEFDRLMAKHVKALQQSPRLDKMSGTVTGRITFGSPPLWNLPKMMGTYSPGPRYTYYLLRKLEVVATDVGHYGLPAFLHSKGQPGDVLVALSYMGKYQAYFWSGKKKRYWRKVDSRKYPDLMPQLRAALLLQQ